MSPQIEFNTRDIAMGKRLTKAQVVQAHDRLYVMVENIVEQAFREYAKKHGCDPKMENTEWSRFKRILEKYL